MSGLAEYPGYVCYDATRPSWLPYWLDTLGEETCKLSQVAGNVKACLNPVGTQCSPDSYVNFNMVSGQPNLDPNVSGAGILGTDTGSNAPPGLLSSIAGGTGSFNLGTTLQWVGIGLLALFLVKR
jgi:hypothetical protein